MFYIHASPHSFPFQVSHVYEGPWGWMCTESSHNLTDTVPYSPRRLSHRQARVWPRTGSPLLTSSPHIQVWWLNSKWGLVFVGHLHDVVDRAVFTVMALATCMMMLKVLSVIICILNNVGVRELHNGQVCSVSIWMKSYEILVKTFSQLLENKSAVHKNTRECNY